MFGKIHIIYCACVHPHGGLSCSPSTKQVTRRVQLHLQSNSFQMKRTQALHFIIIAICLSATHSNSSIDPRLAETTNCEAISDSVT